MTDRERIAAELRAAISLLQARAAELTPLERMKLTSLLLNLQSLLAAPTREDGNPEAGGEATDNCGCNVCKLR